MIRKKFKTKRKKKSNQHKDKKSSNGSPRTGKEVKQGNLPNLYLTHVIPISGKPQSLCESILTPRNDVVPDISFSAASNALRISDDTVPGIGEEK